MEKYPKDFLGKMNAKAAEIGIPPALLMLTVAVVSSPDYQALREIPEIVEKDIIQNHFSTLIAQMKELSQKFLESQDVKEREVGEYSLSKYDGDYLVNEVNREDLFRLFPDFEAQDLLNFEAAGIKTVIQEVRDIKARYGIEPLPQIIERLCKPEIEHYRLVKSYYGDEINLS